MNEETFGETFVRCLRNPIAWIIFFVSIFISGYLGGLE